VEEGLSAEHGGELLTNTLEHLLDGSGVTEEGDWHLEALWWDIADWWLDVVGDPFNEVAGVLVLNIEHLFINLLGGHTATEHCGGSEVATVTWVRGAHHVLGIEHLGSEFWDSECTVLLGATGGKGSETSHEEVETGEGDKVNSKLAEVRVELTWEAEAAGNTRECSWDEVVKVTIGWGGELEGSEANIVEGFVIDAHNLISVFNKLMDWKGGVVGLNDGVRDLGGWHNGEGSHDSVGVLFTDLGDKEGAHTWTGTTTEGVGDLETLEAVATFSFLTDDVEDWVNKLSTFGVVTLGPVVTSTGLTEDEVVGSEKLTEGASTNGVHSAGLEVHKDSARNVTATGCFVEVNVDALELEVWVTVVGTSWVNSVFIRDDFPELSTDLVTALAGLDVDNFTHVWFWKKVKLIINFDLARLLKGTRFNYSNQISWRN
jgi:hypothetical protein